VSGLGARCAHLRQEMVDERISHRAYTREFGDDPPDIRNWVWPGSPRASQPAADAASDTSADM